MKNSFSSVEGKVLFLGDSITDQGHYISFLNCYFAMTQNKQVSLVNAGVSSETCSGLSEEDHPFVRPCVLRRAQAALEFTKPDWVVLCYGVNDGIYAPFSNRRFVAFQAGIRSLVATVRAYGARVILLTPLCFDALSFAGACKAETEGAFSYLQPYAGYDTVLEAYSAWILGEAAALADFTVDLRTPLLADLAAMRSMDCDYRSGDGIHPNLHGHALVAKTLLLALFGVQTEALEPWLATDGAQIFGLIYERDQIEHLYYKESIGHDNPQKNLPPPDWESQTAVLNAQINTLLCACAPLVYQACWEGFATETFFDAFGFEVIVAKPHSAAAGRPWVWRAEFFGAFPSADLALLQHGWHVAQLRIPNRYGCPSAVEQMECFRQMIIQKYALTNKAVLFGFSRGGLYAANYAAAYPQAVAALYLDAPVVDTTSWPGGKGSGVGAPGEWRQCRAAYGEDFDEPTRRQNVLAALVNARLPLALVAGGRDDIVPYAENGALLQAAYEAAEIPFLLVIKQQCKHHPHSLDNPACIVHFLEKFTQPRHVPMRFNPADACAVLVVMGQSNAHGHGTHLAKGQEINTPLSHVFGLSREQNQAYGLSQVQWSGYTSHGMNLGETQDHTHCLATHFARLWEDAVDGGAPLPPLYLVQISIGSQGIASQESDGNNMWYPGRAPVLKSGALGTVDISLYPLAMEILHLVRQDFLQRGKHMVPLGLHWNQWETEVSTGGAAIVNAAENYGALFSGFRAALGEDFPLYLYRPLSEIYQNPQAVAQLTALFARMEAKDARVHIIDLSKTALWQDNTPTHGIFLEDGVHYTPQSHARFAALQWQAVFGQEK